VVNDRNEILDGIHRYRACQELNIPVRTLAFEAIRNVAPNQCLEEVAYIYAANAERRHLNATQKAVLSLEYLPALRKQAKARIRAGADRARRIRAERCDGNGNGSSTEESATCLRTRDALAECAGVSPITIDRVLSVKNHAPELLPAMASGQLAATHAAKIVRAKKNGSAVSVQTKTSSHTSSFSEEEVLRQWQAVWRAFVLKFMPHKRKEVRGIVLKHLSGLKS